MSKLLNLVAGVSKTLNDAANKLNNKVEELKLKEEKNKVFAQTRGLSIGCFQTDYPFGLPEELHFRAAKAFLNGELEIVHQEIIRDEVSGRMELRLKVKGAFDNLTFIKTL